MASAAADWTCWLCGRVSIRPTMTCKTSLAVAGCKWLGTCMLYAKRVRWHQLEQNTMQLQSSLNSAWLSASVARNLKKAATKTNNTNRAIAQQRKVMNSGIFITRYFFEFEQNCLKLGEHTLNLRSLSNTRTNVYTCTTPSSTTHN